MRQSAVVVFPGRGTYGKGELGYLARHHGDKAEFLAGVDAWRRANGRTPVAEIDAARVYAAAQHASSLNASALTYACALADFADIDRDRYDIVAVCGNSLGWYLTLAGAAAVRVENAIRLVDTMGALMESKGGGGQLVYPLVDVHWRADAEREAAVRRALDAGRRAGAAYWSIHLGGMAVLAGDEKGLAAMEETLPKADDRYPFRLARHAAFHTPLLSHVSKAALDTLEPEVFGAPEIPMIDGRGAIWTPGAADPVALRGYTLGAQIIEPYNFSKSIEVAIKEFAPDRLILVGPGATLGAPIGQTLIAHRWLDLSSKEDFADRQSDDPFLLAMGRDDQRALVTANAN